MSDTGKHRIANWTFRFGIISLMFGSLCLLGYALSRIFAMKADFYIEFTVMGVILTTLGSYLRSRLKKSDLPAAAQPENVVTETEMEWPTWESDDQQNNGPNDSVHDEHDETAESKLDPVDPVELAEESAEAFVYSDRDNSIRSHMSDIIGDWSKWNEFDNDPIKVRNVCKNLKDYTEDLLQSDEIYLKSKADIDYDRFSACFTALWDSINGAMYNLSSFVKNDRNRLILPSEDVIKLLLLICDVILSYTETVSGVR